MLPNSPEFYGSIYQGVAREWPLPPAYFEITAIYLFTKPLSGGALSAGMGKKINIARPTNILLTSATFERQTGRSTCVNARQEKK